MGQQRQLNRLRTSTKHLLSVFHSDPFTLSQVSQPGQSQLRPSKEHCFIVRVPGAKGCPGCKTLPSLPPRQNFSVSFSLSQLVARWRDGRISFYCAPLLTRPPERAKTRSSPKRAHSDRARSSSKEAGRPSHLHCHPLTSYPFSIKHRTTASA